MAKYSIENLISIAKNFNPIKIIKIIKTNKIMKKNYSLILLICLVLGFGLLFWPKQQIIEPLRRINYKDEGDLFSGDVNSPEMNFAVVATDAKLQPKLDQAIEKNKKDDTIINNTPCSKFSVIHSDYDLDICKEYGDNYVDLNERCKKLSTTNCNIPSCCVLVDGDKCRAGTSTGPVFSTENGIDLDYDFYLHKEQCYGVCDPEARGMSLSQCAKYSENSTNVSKDCMMQMFNKYACQENLRNPEESFVDSDFYERYKNLSKQQIEAGLKETCTDYYKECNKYDDDSIGISTNCMVKMMNRLGCPNSTPTFSDTFISSNTKKPFKEIKEIMINLVNTLMVNVKGNNTDAINYCYGTKK